MLADNHKSMASGKIEGPEIDTPIIAVVDFVTRILVTFSDKYAGSDIKNEKGLTQKLVLILNFHAKREYYPFWFEKEYMEVSERGDSPQVDIATITSYEKGIVIGSRTYRGESFFSLEAKRLGSLSPNRSKEYLIGRSEKGKYINYVLKSTLGPMKWEVKVEVMEILLKKLKDHLPEKITSKPAEQLAANMDAVLISYSKAIDKITSLFRSF